MSFKQELSKAFKDKRVSELPEIDHKNLKLKSVNDILSTIQDKTNRFIFYCPDIAVVNPLVKLVYEIALEVKNLGYNVCILHELNGFKAHWLYSDENYEQYKDLKVEYVMNKNPGKKTRKTTSNYSFSMSDTLIVTDVHQEILENLMQDERMILVQKIVLITGYMGLSSLRPGMDYNRLGVNSLVFFDDLVKADYDKLFDNKCYLVDNYQVSAGFVNNQAQVNDINPVIGISSIGNNDKAQQLINIFYNLYPNLSVFTFKIVARDNITNFIENIRTSAAVVILDKDIVTKQMIYESINMGTPLFIPYHRELVDNKQIVENFMVSEDVFEIAEKLAEFCNYWISSPNSVFVDSIKQIASDLELEQRTPNAFRGQVEGLFTDLYNNRLQTFNKIKENIENE